MSKFDELKKEAEIAIEQKWFIRLREEDAAAILELLAIQAQLVGALKSIALWELPETGKEWPTGGKVSYEAEYGSNGARDYIRQVAFVALAAAGAHP